MRPSSYALWPVNLNLLLRVHGPVTELLLSGARIMYIKLGRTAVQEDRRYHE